MENETFTLAELTGLSFWGATWPALIILALIALAVVGDILFVLCKEYMQKKVRKTTHL